MRDFFLYELDYLGNPLPKFETRNIAIPNDIDRMFPMFYDIVNRYIYYGDINIISVYQQIDDKMDKTEQFRFEFYVSSISVDHYMNLSFILDANENLWALCLWTRFIRLLARNVTDFEYSLNNL
ncbi:hypothetical protein RF11_01663 [Thelohanellus kitauei]|uniref:Uncharacterized protein n=1 Tax=Thelohanellus kitauei TaxID=669202 RepID=A0A0C2N0U3_THEKT|nr:hypothetical protein RF11_01663 [Thelohanellus kitauei]